jgi:hypothetical protein
MGNLIGHPRDELQLGVFENRALRRMYLKGRRNMRMK